MQRSEVHTAATTIAREVLETIQDEGGFGCLPIGDASFNGANPDSQVDGFPPAPYPMAIRGEREFVLRVEVEEESDRMSAVLVTVSWDGGRVQLEKAFHASDSAL